MTIVSARLLILLARSKDKRENERLDYTGLAQSRVSCLQQRPFARLPVILNFRSSVGWAV